MLRHAVYLLNNASGLVSKALSDEEDAMDNTPDNLQGSDRYEKMEQSIDLLDEASDCIDMAIEKINEAAS